LLAAGVLVAGGFVGWAPPYVKGLLFWFWRLGKALPAVGEGCQAVD